MNEGDGENEPEYEHLNIRDVYNLFMDTNSKHRHSIRLPEYDYSQPGAYFVTIVTQNRRCLFGRVEDGEMVLNESGKMVKQVWVEIPQHYQGVSVDIFVIMPNHVHGLINLNDAIVGATPCGCPVNMPEQAGQARGPAPTENRLSLPDIVHRFKSLTTNYYMAGVRQNGWTVFDKHIWQRNYYEHIIRNERDLQAITDYILANPQNWEKDEEYQRKLVGAKRLLINSLSH